MKPKLAWLVALCAIASDSSAQENPRDAGAEEPEVESVPAGWPRAMPQPDGLRDVLYPYGALPATHTDLAECRSRCVLEFNVLGAPIEVWQRWLTDLRSHGWTVHDEHANNGVLWGEVISPAPDADRYIVTLGNVAGGGRGELRRMSHPRQGRPPAISSTCTPLETAANVDHVASGRIIAWPFDLDRDGTLDAAVSISGGWGIYIVRGACAFRVGQVWGNLIRISDEETGPDGWLVIETNSITPLYQGRIAYAHHNGRYVQIRPPIADAGVPSP